MAALLVGDALRGATLDQALVTAMRDRQRAFETAEWGLAHAETSVRQWLPLEPADPVIVDDQSRAVVTTTLVTIDALPPGFSTGRVLARRLLATSEGRTSRGARVRLDLGLTRLEPAP